jgi:hypothetical protein
MAAQMQKPFVGQCAAHRTDVAPAQRAHHVVEQFLVNHLDWMVAMWTANLHGWAVPGMPYAFTLS